MNKEQLQRVKHQIADRNRRFDKMTDSQKRVTIARDVIKILEGEMLGITMKAQNMTYFITSASIYSHLTPELELRNALIGEQCTVCALGAAFTGAVMRSNNLTLGKLPCGVTNIIMRQYLNQWFSTRTLLMIEAAFETNASFAWSPACSKQDARRAADFGENFAKAHDRLIAIMENIIKNNGEFIP